MNPYESVVCFENEVAKFTGSKNAIAVDSCTNALFLACKYLQVQQVVLPRKTYLSVACSVINAGGSVRFEDIEWQDSYYLSPYPIIDAAPIFEEKMYVKGTFSCISFSANKRINIGKGGMILTDNDDAASWFKMARYMGKSLESDVPKFVGWNMYMLPEQAARGLLLLHHVKQLKVSARSYLDYPDISTYGIYK